MTIFGSYYNLYIRNISFSYNSLSQLRPGDNPEPAPIVEGATQALPANEDASPTAIPAPAPVSKGSEPVDIGATAVSSFTLRIESFSFKFEKKTGIENAEHRVRKNHGHRFARPRALRRNMRRYLKHLMRKVNKDMKKFIRKADLPEEQAEKLKEALDEFKEGLKDLMKLIRENKNIEPQEIKDALKELASSLLKSIDDIFTPEPEQIEPGEKIAIPEQEITPVKLEPIPVIDEEQNAIRVDIQTIRISSTIKTGDIEPGEVENKEPLKALEELRNHLTDKLEKTFDRTFKRISRMLDRLFKQPPHPAATTSCNIEINYISIYQSFSTQDTNGEEASLSKANPERPVLYA